MGTLRLSSALLALVLCAPAFAQDEPAGDAQPAEQPDAVPDDAAVPETPTAAPEAPPAAPEPVPHGPLAKQLYGHWGISLEGEFKREWEVMAIALELSDDSLSKKQRKGAEKRRAAMKLTDPELQIIAGIAMVAAMGTPDDIANFRAVIEGMSTATLDVSEDTLHFTFGPESEDAAWSLVKETEEDLTILTVEQSEKGPKESESTVVFPDADTFIITEHKADGDATMTFKRKK